MIGRAWEWTVITLLDFNTVSLTTKQNLTDRSVPEVPDPALEYDCPAQGGVDQGPARVDEVGRRLGVYHLVGEI